MDETLWHKCSNPIIPRRTVDGGWTAVEGQTWRRKTESGWEYRQDKETEDGFFDRAW